jgi:hypothetical protein
MAAEKEKVSFESPATNVSIPPKCAREDVCAERERAVELALLLELVQESDPVLDLALAPAPARRS